MYASGYVKAVQPKAGVPVYPQPNVQQPIVSSLSQPAHTIRRNVPIPTPANTGKPTSLVAPRMAFPASLPGPPLPAGHSLPTPGPAKKPPLVLQGLNTPQGLGASGCSGSPHGRGQTASLAVAPGCFSKAPPPSFMRSSIAAPGTPNALVAPPASVALAGTSSHQTVSWEPPLQRQLHTPAVKQVPQPVQNVRPEGPELNQRETAEMRKPGEEFSQDTAASFESSQVDRNLRSSDAQVRHDDSAHSEIASLLRRLSVSEEELAQAHLHCEQLAEECSEEKQKTKQATIAAVETTAEANFRAEECQMSALDLENAELRRTVDLLRSTTAPIPAEGSYSTRPCSVIAEDEVRFLRTELARRDKELLVSANARRKAADQAERGAAALRAKLAELEAMVAATPSTSSRASSSPRGSEIGAPCVNSPPRGLASASRVREDCPNNGSTGKLPGLSF